jgi:PLP dependent protein
MKPIETIAIASLPPATRLFLENVKNVFRKISSASIRSGRNPFDVKLVAVTKTVGTDKIREAIDLGLRSFGENRVQEAEAKIAALKTDVQNEIVEWHLVGHLQKNKVKTAVHLFDLIHSVDSPELAKLIDTEAGKLGKVQRVLIQVKLSEEETKHGVAAEKLPDLLRAVSGMDHLSLEGLMTLPPFFEDPEKARPFFRRLRELRDEAESEGLNLPELSMGMTNDFEAAILEGATIVRIGTALFGERKVR